MEPLPEDVTRFIDQSVESIDQLEILRVLGEAREKEWDSHTLASVVQTEPEVILAHMKAMHRRGLVQTTVRGEGLMCRYGVSSPELELMLSRLLQLYKERPVTMIKLVYSRARDPLRAFADAFRIRKED